MDGIQTVAENVDQIMGCHCDALVSLIDSYVDKRYTIIRSVFRCQGCGKMVEIEGKLTRIMDIDQVEKIRNIEEFRNTVNHEDRA